MHPGLGIAWYEDLLRDIKRRYPALNVHGLSPPEIHHISQVSGPVDRRGPRAAPRGRPGKPARRRGGNPRRSRSPAGQSVQGLGRRLAGGLPPLASPRRPGLGHDDVRPPGDLRRADRASRPPPPTPGRDRRVHGLHLLDLPAAATPPWPSLPKAGAAEYLKTLAVSRLYLDNFANLQASWVTQGLKIGQLALRFGANDLGSLMIEENVVAAAGTCFRATHEEMLDAIRGAGYEPRRRNVFYEVAATGT